MKLLMILMVFFVITNLKPQEGSYEDIKFYTTGTKYLDSSMYDLAITCFNRAIELNPGNTIYYYKRGEAYFKKDDFNAALNDFIHCSNIIVDEPEYAYLSGLCNDKLNNYEDAIKNFSQAINLDSTDLKYLKCRANLYLKNKNYQFAILDYTKLLKYDSLNGQIYYYKGICNLKINDLESACDDWENARLNNYTKALDYIEKYCNNIK